MWAAGNNMKHGFTLLELLLVLVIAMLTLAVVAPRFVALLPGVELKTYSQQTAALLRQARSQAIGRSEDVSLTFDPAARETRISGGGKAYPWPENIQLLPTTDDMLEPLPDRRLIFYPDGSASGGIITISSSSRQYRIAVNWLTGSITIHEHE